MHNFIIIKYIIAVIIIQIIIFFTNPMRVDMLSSIQTKRGYEQFKKL